MATLVVAVSRRHLGLSPENTAPDLVALYRGLSSRPRTVERRTSRPRKGSRHDTLPGAATVRLARVQRGTKRRGVAPAQVAPGRVLTCWRSPDGPGVAGMCVDEGARRGNRPNQLAITRSAAARHLVLRRIRGIPIRPCWGTATADDLGAKRSRPAAGQPYATSKPTPSAQLLGELLEYQLRRPPTDRTRCGYWMGRSSGSVGGLDYVLCPGELERASVTRDRLASM